MKKWLTGQLIFYEFGQEGEEFWEQLIAYAQTTPWALGEIEVRLMFEAYECGRLGEEFPSRHDLWKRALRRVFARDKEMSVY